MKKKPKTNRSKREQRDDWSNKKNANTIFNNAVVIQTSLQNTRLIVELQLQRRFRQRNSLCTHVKQFEQ